MSDAPAEETPRPQRGQPLPPITDPQPSRAPRVRRDRGIAWTTLDDQRILRAKQSFATRRVTDDWMRTLVVGPVRPRSGDVVLAKVERIGHHARLELCNGRRAALHLGDEVIVAYADRYAPDQFEAHIPADLGATNLVAAGGIAADMVSRSRDARAATDIVPVGLIGDEFGVPLNLQMFGLPRCRPSATRPPTLAVVGTSMNSGKTTTVRYLVNALSRSGRSPGATKITGTGAGGDYWSMTDAGASAVLDFTDVGLASTYRIRLAVLEEKIQQLLSHLALSGCDTVLIEIADGLFQQETSRLLLSPVVRDQVDAWVFAASDAMGAAAGVRALRDLDLPVVAVSGRLTRSPLAVRETVAACGLPVLDIDGLSDPATACALMGIRPPAPVTECVAASLDAVTYPEPAAGPVSEGPLAYEPWPEPSGSPSRRPGLAELVGRLVPRPTREATT